MNFLIFFFHHEFWRNLQKKMKTKLRWCQEFHFKFNISALEKMRTLNISLYECIKHTTHIFSKISILYWNLIDMKMMKITILIGISSSFTRLVDLITHIQFKHHVPLLFYSCWREFKLNSYLRVFSKPVMLLVIKLSENATSSLLFSH